MINGFEEQTSDLDGYDKSILVPAMVRGLKTKIGKANAITNKAMVKAMESHGYSINDVKVRKIINYIRNNDLVPCLIATSKGYYIGESLQEMEEYVQSLMQRESAIKQIRQAIRKQIDERYSNENQTSLFE